MSDPDAAQQEPAPPPQPPRPIQAPKKAPRNQLEADELYARQLAEHYNNQNAYRQSPREPPREYRGDNQRRERNYQQDDLYDDRERSFIDGK